MKTSTTTLTPVSSTTDLITYDNEYKSDIDRFNEMSTPTQIAVIGGGIIAVGALGYALYKGIQYMRDTRIPYYGNRMYYPQQVGYYGQQPYYQNPMQQSAVNVQGQYAYDVNQQPTVTFQANTTPVAPQQYIQYPYYQSEQRYVRVPAPNGQVQDVPVNPQQYQAPVYQQPIAPPAQPQQ